MREIEPRGDQDPAEDVAPHLIGAEPVQRAGRLQDVVEVGGVGIVRDDPGRQRPRARSAPT